MEMIDSFFASIATCRLCVKYLAVVFSLYATSAALGQHSIENERLRRACDYLWSQQADDGGWHSPQYAVLRSGQALTPFVLHALLGASDSISSDKAHSVRRAVDFIRKHTDVNGVLGRADPEVLEYPVYGTAYAVLCLKRIQSDPLLHRLQNYDLIMRLEAYLIRAQFDEADGFEPRDAAYGGWGFDIAHEPGRPGHMDLAHTRRALAALDAPIDGASSGHYRAPADLALVHERARKFLKLVQKHPDVAQLALFDGGFYFSPVVLDANKGREEIDDNTKYFRSYATATCDGVLALLASGVPRDDDRIVRAAAWLWQHDNLAYPQGVPTDHPEPWGEAIQFYHFAVRAEAYSALKWPGDWKTQLAAEVARHQSADGSVSNEASPLMKEDDPLLCTALATIALTHCQTGISE
jgi:hypothetical protein